MPSAFYDFFNENFVKFRLNAKLSDLNCVLGSSGIVISLLLLIITIFGLFKLLNYCESINFEISLFLFSILQIVLLDIIILIPHDFLFEIFFFIQMIHISLTIRKFLNITGNNREQFKEILIFIILNLSKGFSSSSSSLLLFLSAIFILPNLSNRFSSSSLPFFSHF